MRASVTLLASAALVAGCTTSAERIAHVDAVMERYAGTVPGASVLVLHDVSERKRAEQRVRQAHKLESIGLVAGGIPHYFN